MSLIFVGNLHVTVHKAYVNEKSFKNIGKDHLFNTIKVEQGRSEYFT